MRRTTGVVLGAMVMLGCGPRITVVDGDDAGAADDGSSSDGTASGPGGGSGGDGDDSGPDDGQPPDPSVGDDAGEESSGGPGRADWVDEAEEMYPTFRDLFEGSLARTCSVFNNVCHSNKEYPELSQPEHYLAVYGAPCNVPEKLEEPLEVFEACEGIGDRAVFQLGSLQGFESEVGWVAFDEASQQYVITLRDDVPFDNEDEGDLIAIFTDAGPSEWPTFYARHVGNVLTVPMEELSVADREALLGDVQQGDINRSGVFGADDPMEELKLGDPEGSYLLQRLLGEVPGSPMPLANQPQTEAELGALTCWIEQTLVADPSQLDVPIDYDNCSAALGD